MINIRLILSNYGLVSWSGQPFSTKLNMIFSEPVTFMFLSKNNFKAILDHGSIGSFVIKFEMVIGEPVLNSSKFVSHIRMPSPYITFSPCPVGEEAS